MTYYNDKEEEEEEVDVDVDEDEDDDDDDDDDDEDIFMIPLSSPSTRTRQWDQQLQHPHRCCRRQYRQPSIRITTTKEVEEESKNKQPLFLERRIARSVSLGDTSNERPCMKKTSATRCGAMVDCPILRPYRQLSSELLQCLGEESTDLSATTTTTTTHTSNSDDYTQASDSSSTFDSDCEYDYDLDDPAKTEIVIPAIPTPVAFTTDTTVLPQSQIASPEDRRFSIKKMNYKGRNSALLFYKSIIDYPSTEQEHQNLQRQEQRQRQRPCIAESNTSWNRSRVGGHPMSLMLGGLPIMPRRQLSIGNLCRDDFLNNNNKDDDDDNDDFEVEGGGEDNE